MKTAGRGTPNRWTIEPGNRAQDAVGQNRPDSIKGAAKVEKFQPRETCFFLTFPFIEVVSMGRRNTFLEFTRRRLKTQSLSWALIQAQRDFVQIRLGIAG